jgi:hypothetical protein
VIVLFVAHLFALGIYGLGVLCFELHRAAQCYARGKTPILSAADAAIFAVPFLLCAGLLFASRTGGDAGLIAWNLDGKTTGIMFAFEIFSRPIGFASLAIFAGLLLWGWRTHQLRLHPVGAIVIAIGALLFLAMPFQLFGSAFADSRLPIAIIFLAIGMMQWMPSSRISGLVAAVGLGLLIAARLVDGVTGMSHFAKAYADFESSFQSVEPGSRILTAAMDGNPHRLSAMLITHMPVLAMAERSSLVSTAFTDPGEQVLETRSALRPYVATVGWPPRIPYLLTDTVDPEAQSASRSFSYSGWREHYDYLYVLFAAPGTRIPDRALSLVYQGKDFQLYAVNAGVRRHG